MKTKIFCLLAALVGALFMLASCGDPPDDPNGDGGYNWNKTTLIFELSLNGNKNELSSQVKRYYAGEDDRFHAEIDDEIAARNELAETTTNVDVLYDYTPTDTENYTWGKNVERIQTLVNSGAAEIPDMYCNFSYDLTCAALKGVFANLYSTSHGEGNNYFEFAKEGYLAEYEAALEGSESSFDSSIGKGYFFDYMRSLSLSDDKMYCLASDYCTDLVRAFLVVPVNIKLMGEIGVSHSTGDLNNDQTFNIADFYELVWDGDFTYDAVAKLSEAIYADENNDTERNFGDKLGFAAGYTGSGLTASGILYTTSVSIITNTPHTDASGKEYAFSYSATNEALGQFADALNNLFTKTGVVAVGSDDVKRENPQANTELEGIRSSFAQNMILFGGVIAVGSLEDNVYQEMRDDIGGGFGIAPVPLYKAGDEYLTLVHNIARIIAISRTTSKFEQCSAFLNYQSTNSADIIDAYYNEELVSKVNTGAAGGENVKMLNYIRNHVRNCFDKTYEDAVSRYKMTEDQDALSKRWHEILARGQFRVTNIRSQYESLYGEKQRFLEDIIDEWKKFS